MSTRPRIGITLGDPAGIGPEVVAKALRSGRLDRRFDYEIIGNPRTKRRADAADWVAEGAKRCLDGDLAALVTAPITKELLHRAGYPFVGQTEFLAHLSGTKRFAMMLAGGPLRVALVTTHAPLREVAKLITGRKIVEVVELSDQICRRFGIRHPRIAVAGLNPHAGEGGLLGDEERRVIAPAVRRAARHGIAVSGPHSADTLFYRAAHGQFDAVVAMYHDQGLAPLKLIAFDTGVNLTLGLPFVRTSPDHGTAPDIAGKGIARPEGMIAAINMAAQLARGSSR
ncbi:MAG: 4-hydroxythreonine-4-phosphate dehydrogenase PdxA [Verrucomicrobiia bacterium]